MKTYVCSPPTCAQSAVISAIIRLSVKRLLHYCEGAWVRRFAVCAVCDKLHRIASLHRRIATLTRPNDCCDQCFCFAAAVGRLFTKLQKQLFSKVKCILARASCGSCKLWWSCVLSASVGDVSVCGLTAAEWRRRMAELKTFDRLLCL